MKLVLTTLTLETLSILLRNVLIDPDHLQEKVQISYHHTLVFDKLLQFISYHFSISNLEVPWICYISASFWTLHILFLPFQKCSFSFSSTKLMLCYFFSLQLSSDARPPLSSHKQPQQSSWNHRIKIHSFLFFHSRLKAAWELEF